MSNIYQFSDITQFLQNGDTSSKVVDINSFFQNKQVVGGSSTDILNANLYNYNYVKGHGNIIEFPNINNNLNGGIKRAPIVNSVEEINTTNGTVTYSSNKYSTVTIPFETAVQNALACFGLAVVDEQKNFLISEIWNAIAVDTFGVGDRISEDDVANGFFRKHIQAFCDKNGISYLPWTIYDKTLDFLIDNGYFTEASTEDYTINDVGNTIDLTPGNFSNPNVAFNGLLGVVTSVRLPQVTHAVNLFKSHAPAQILDPVNPYNFYKASVTYVNNTTVLVELEGIYTNSTSYKIINYNNKPTIAPTIYNSSYKYSMYVENGAISRASGTGMASGSYYFIIPPSGSGSGANATSIANHVPSKFNTEYLVRLILGDIIDAKVDIPLEFPDFWKKRDEIGTINPDWIAHPEAPEINPIAPLVIVPSPTFFPTQSPVEMPITDPDFQKRVQGGENPNREGEHDEPYMPIIYPQYVPVSVPTTIPVEVGNPDIPPVLIPTSPNPNPGNDGQDKGDDDNTRPDEGTPTPTPIPPIVDIGGSASALYTVYNPSKNNLNALGAYLWTSDILEQLVRIFTNNPMDAIISLHSIYCSPSLGGNSNIKLGYLDAGSGTNCPTVNSQFVSIDCGYVDIPEYFGDCRDYSPYTNVTIFLPFIGFRTVKTEDIVAGRVNIKYNIDVLTGSCVAIVSVRKKGVSHTLYTFEGNCSMSLPLTGADHTRMIAGLSSAVLGGVTGGVAGAVMGGVNAMASGSFQANIQRSGSFSGNAGAMSIKKPYIIVNRDYIYDAESYNELYGFPANISTRLGDCSGYNRVKSVHVDSISNATKEEKDEIESILRSGFIL